MHKEVRLFSSAAAVAALCLGLLLKAERYGPATKLDFSPYANAIEASFSASGWRRRPSPSHADDDAYQALTFVHDSCATPLNVLILGYTVELAHLLRARHSDDLALIQNGREVNAFDPRKLQIQKFRDALIRHVSIDPTPTPPLLAMTPARETLDRACPTAPIPPAATLFAPSPATAPGQR